MIQCSALESTGGCVDDNWARRQKEREGAVLFKHPDYGNYKWIYWGESVCPITAEQSDMDVINGTFPLTSELTKMTPATMETVALASQLEDINNKNT